MDRSAPETRRGLLQALAAVPLLDWLMLVLAVFSVALLAWETWGPVDAAQRALIVRIDLAVCAIFAVEFCWRWSRAGWARSFVLRNWYEILGMIPAAHPALRAFRLLRLIRIAVLIARVGAAADRAFGEYYTYLLLRRFKGLVVDALRGVITVAVLEEVAAVLRKGRYTRNVALALEQNLGEIEDVVVDTLAADPQLGRLKRLPFYEDLVRGTTRATLRVVLHALEDPRTDELVADVLRENLDQLRAAVRARDEARDRALAARMPDPGA